MVGFINSSLLLINLRIILFADFGPKPGNFETTLINSSISTKSFIYYKGHLKPGIPNSPVAFEISSFVFDFKFVFALL